MGTSPTDIVVVGAEAPVAMLPLLVRSGTWIIHVFVPAPRFGSRLTSLIERRALHAERSRRRRAVTIVVPTPEWSDAYGSTGADVVCMPLAGIRSTTPISDAATQLGIPAGRRVALLFGATHSEKDADTVAAAFRTLDDSQ